MDGVSVVVPCYNSARYLPACLDSILEQKYPGPLEILVADDGSRDATRDIAAGYGSSVRLLQHPGGANRGVSATRNLCMTRATQPLLAFLDSDDVWLPGHLEGLTRALAEAPDAGLAYNNGAYLLDDGRIGGTRFSPGHQSLRAEELLLDCMLAVNGILIRQHVLDAVGLFEVSLSHGEDHDLWLRILERYPAVYVDQKGWLYRRYEGQSSGQSEKMWHGAQQTLQRARERGYYPEPLLRKRQAVIDFRLGTVALNQRRLLRAGYHFSRAAWNDPLRSLSVVWSRFTGTGSSRK